MDTKQTVREGQMEQKEAFIKAAGTMNKGAKGATELLDVTPEGVHLPLSCTEGRSCKEQ